MATSDNEQRSINVPQHKRIAAGAPINGQSLNPGTKAPAAKTPAKKK